MYIDLGSGQSLVSTNFTVLKFFLAIFKILFLSERLTIGKISFPLFFKYFFDSLSTLLTKIVPSSPHAHGMLFVYHGETSATFFAIAEIDSTIRSNFLPFHGL